MSAIKRTNINHVSIFYKSSQHHIKLHRDPLEELFSIFEPHAEWIKKGKANNKVEIGHNILVATDQFDFILYHKVLIKQADVEQPIPLADKLILNQHKQLPH